MYGSRRHRHLDRAHHHPSVRRNGHGWMWECRCGGVSFSAATWHQAIVSALLHASTIAA